MHAQRTELFIGLTDGWAPPSGMATNQFDTQFLQVNFWLVLPGRSGIFLKTDCGHEVKKS